MKTGLLAGLIGTLLAATSLLAGSPTLPTSTEPALTLLMLGQSNMDGTNSLPPSPLLLAGAREEHLAWCYYKDRQWGLLQDPYAGGTAYYPKTFNAYAGASVAPGIARRLMPTVGNLAFVPAAKGGSTISAWLYRPPGGLSYLDMAVEQARASGHHPNAACWWQGESDSTPPGTIAIQYKSSLAQIAARLFAEFGCPLLVAAIQTNNPAQYPNQGVIQQAQRESWMEVPHVAAGPDLSSLETLPQDSVHLADPAKIDEASARWAAAIQAEIGGA